MTMVPKLHDPQANANLKQVRLRPHNSSELASQIRAAERALIEITRERDAARVALPALLVQGDASAIATGRQRITEATALFHSASDGVELLRDAVKLARTSERQSQSSQNLTEIDRLAANVTVQSKALQGAIEATGKHLRAVFDALDALDIKLAASEVPIDPYLFRAKVLGIVQTALAIYSDSQLGKNPTGWTAHELKKTALASIAKTSIEFEGVLLKKVRGHLNVDEPAPPEAA